MPSLAGQGLVLPVNSLPRPSSLTPSVATPHVSLSGGDDRDDAIDTHGQRVSAIASTTAISTPASYPTLHREWLIFHTLTTHPSCSPESQPDTYYEAKTGQLSRAQSLCILSGFFAFSPPLQHEHHIHLLATLVTDPNDLERPLPLSMRNPPPLPTHLRWQRVLELAFFIRAGLQAAATRTGSAGNTTLPTPKWLKMQTRFVGAANLRTGQSPSRTIASPAAHTANTSDTSDSSDGNPGDRIPRDPMLAADARTRDGRCQLTGDSFPSGLVTAHIIPYSCGCYEEALTKTYFWFFLELWLGSAVAKTIWTFVGATNINRLENLITLTSTMHSRFGDGSMIIEPVAETFLQKNGGQSSRSRDAVLVQISELAENALGCTVTLRSVFSSPSIASDQARHNPASLDTGMPQMLTNGAYIVLSRRNGTSATHVDLPLPDPNILAIFSTIMRMRTACLSNSFKPLSGPPTAGSHLLPRRHRPKPTRSYDLGLALISNTSKILGQLFGFIVKTLFWVLSPRQPNSPSHPPCPPSPSSASVSSCSTPYLSSQQSLSSPPTQHTHASRLSNKLHLLQQAQSTDEGILLGHERRQREQEKRDEMRAYRRLGFINFNSEDEEEENQDIRFVVEPGHWIREFVAGT